jgi:hypothetical protein
MVESSHFIYSVFIPLLFWDVTERKLAANNIPQAQLSHLHRGERLKRDM